MGAAHISLIDIYVSLQCWIAGESKIRLNLPRTISDSPTPSPGESQIGRIQHWTLTYTYSILKKITDLFDCYTDTKL
jgi:hypothetical protein